jgi:lipid-A-disaccharide synthase-like uncharacterized protein
MSWLYDVQSVSVVEKIWIAVGFSGQFLFSMRFLYQWFKSEQVKRSVVPEAFWYFSFMGGVILLTYAIHRHDMVFIVGQASGLLIYIRNIWLIWGEKRRQAKALAKALAGMTSCP